MPVWGVTHAWLSEYLQNRQDCYFPWSFNKEFSSMCSDSTLPVTDSSFESDFWCIFATDTLLSFLKGTSLLSDINVPGEEFELQYSPCARHCHVPDSAIEQLIHLTTSVYQTRDGYVVNNSI